MFLENNSFEFEVFSRYALFTDPITKTGGEKSTYHIPTYEALKGITKSIYWKPTIVWIIDRVRIMNHIQTECKGVKLLKYQSSGSDLAYYTFLVDVRYQVKVHYIWNNIHQNLQSDYNQKKHSAMFNRSIERGGRQDIFLGTRDCQGYVQSCKFGSGSSPYDQAGKLNYGLTFHSFEYPDEVETKTLNSLFWRPTLDNGVINFIKPNECSVRRELKPMSAKKFIFNKNINCDSNETEPCL
jgi:CRISPR-associated protein Cas5d